MQLTLSESLSVLAGSETRSAEFKPDREIVGAVVVGIHRFAYDLWGDVVNTASRMESGGVPGSIQVTEATFELIRDDFVCEPRGVISVKGKGEMNTYLLVGRR